MKKRVTGILLCLVLLLCMGKDSWMVRKALASTEDYGIEDSVQADFEQENSVLEEIPEEDHMTGEEIFLPEASLITEAEEELDFLEDSFASVVEVVPEPETEAGGLTAEENSIFALAPMSLMAEFEEDSEEKPREYQVILGDYLDVDEVSKWEVYREIVYVDFQGIQRSSPLYCLQADYHGISGGNIHEEAIRALQNSAIRKLLYFGYGGPGDICDEFDPSCGHIDWEKADNRYIFTHMALTKVYSGQYGDSNEWEYEHCGVNRFLNRILSLAIPDRNGVVLSSHTTNGAYQTGRNLPLPLTLYRTLPEEWQWVDNSQMPFGGDVQTSANIRVIDTAKAGNSVLVSRPEGSLWQLGYWNSQEDFSERGQSNPRVLREGETIELKDGSCFCMAFSQYLQQEQSLSFTTSLRPVSFLIVDGKIQEGKEEIQDFGAYVYQGERQNVSLELKPCQSGKLVLHKSYYMNYFNLGMVSGAEYELFAAEDIYQNTILIYKEDERVSSGITDFNGSIHWGSLIPGRYYVKESRSPDGFLLDETKYESNVTPGDNHLYVEDEPDVWASVEIYKVDADSRENLPGAEFMLYTWNDKLYTYTEGVPLQYDADRSAYVLDKVCYTSNNAGMFQIVETRNPEGYTGSFSREISLASLKPGEHETFSFTVENTKVHLPHVEILKIAEDTGEILTGAGFEIYAWNQKLGAYEPYGMPLSFQSDSRKYISRDLVATEQNQGRFLVKETRNPKGYTGNWQQELTLLPEAKSVYEYTVVNSREQQKYRTIKISKKDYDTGDTLTGAEFAIYEWDAEQNCFNKDRAYSMHPEMGYWGYASEPLPITASNKGRFLAVELKNPAGYEGSWSQEIVTSITGVGQNVEAANHRILGEIKVTKKIRAEDIVWAQGIPSFLLVAEGTDDQGVFHKWEKNVSFYPDSYDLDENGYASLNLIFDQVPTGSYQIYERPVLRYYLKSVLAGSDNVSVVQNASPGYGTWPENCFSAEAVLTGENRKASLIFVNEKSRYDGYSHTDIRNNTISILIEENSGEPV